MLRWVTTDSKSEKVRSMSAKQPSSFVGNLAVAVFVVAAISTSIWQPAIGPTGSLIPGIAVGVTCLVFLVYRMAPTMMSWLSPLAGLLVPCRVQTGNSEQIY